MADNYLSIQNLALLILLLVFSVPTLAQTAAEKKPQANTSAEEASRANESDLLKAQRRTFAISLVTSLANEARSYRDQALRPRVLARAADTLWDADNVSARVLFHHAWEAAEKGDAEELTLKNQDGVPPTATAIVYAMRRSLGNDLRADVLALAARRDRALGEEFLSKLKEETKREAEDAKNDSGSRNTSDSWLDSEAVSKKLHLARKLLDDGEVDLALEFAAPVLEKINANSIGFLSALRAKRPEVADQRFAYLLGRAEFNPSSDANTVSGLSSYVFTPGIYVTFDATGGSRSSREDQPIAPPNLPPALRNRFFQVAGSILLRPLPLPDQDFTSSGRTGKYAVIKRLLPLFDQYAPEMAVALRSHLMALTSDGPSRAQDNDRPSLTQGIKPQETADDALLKMQERLDNAKTPLERDSIYADAAVALANQGDARAQDLADKIDDSDRRAQVRQYVDLEFVKIAIRKKDAKEVARLAKAGQLTRTQRVWAYTQGARLLMNSQQPRSMELLGEAVAEARRIDGSDPDRARSLICVATQFVAADRVRAWEILEEAAKSANSTEKFTGENVKLYFSILTKSGIKTTNFGGEEFGLSGVLRLLTKDDLYRSIGLAKSFKNDAPRATAILAIVRAVLEK